MLLDADLTRKTCVAVAVFALAIANEARADPDRPDEASADSTDSTDAPEKRGPPPDEASGVRVPRDGPSPWLWVPRLALLPVQLAVQAVIAPVAGAVWAYERYELRDRFYQVFFNDTETVGLYPIAYYETGFGLSGGARLVVRDLFGRGAGASARASFGGARPQAYTWKANSGDVLGDRVELEVRGAYEIISGSRFFGVGNGDLVEAPGAPVDPRVDDLAVASRYRMTRARGRLSGRVHLTRRLDLGLHGELRDARFGDDPELRGDADIVDVYDRAGLVGFDGGVTSVYPELALRYDSRRTTRYYLSQAVPSTGWLAHLAVGYQVGIDSDQRFPRIAVDVQRSFDLHAGDRVLLARLYVDAVGADVGEVPFIDLPALGGKQLLRGYRGDRFRDLRAGMVSLEYEYPISYVSSGFVFAEAGRVWRDNGDLADTRAGDIRLGYGLGVQLHTKDTFRARFSLFSSIDGDVLFSLSFDPAWDVRSRNPLF